MLSLAHIHQSITDLQTDIFSKLVDRSINFDEMTKITEKSLNELIVEMLQSILLDLEEVIRESSDRKQRFWIHRSDDPKVIATNFGDVEYSRAYYRDKNTKEFTYLLDDLLDIDPHQRMDGNLESRLIDNAKDMSYQKAIENIPNISLHSKQTTYNLVHKLSKANIEAPVVELTDKRTPKYLYIEADEDHVAMQDSTNKQMKFVYVHTGLNYEKSTEKRNVLNIERTFSGWYPNNDELWLEVSAYIEETFDTKNISQIFLSGDGANWIKSGIDYLPANTMFALDGFHIKQSLMRSIVGLGDKAKETLGQLRRWIAFNQKEKVKLFFATRLSDADLSNSARESLKANKKYLLNHWDAIQNQATLGYITCSAEGHVSHILSSRLSSRPLGWSNDGTEIIAKLRVYKLNGGQTNRLIADTNNQTRKERKIIQMDKRVANTKKREYTSISSGSIPNYGTSSSPIGVLKKMFN